MKSKEEIQNMLDAERLAYSDYVTSNDYMNKMKCAGRIEILAWVLK